MYKLRILFRLKRCQMVEEPEVEIFGSFASRITFLEKGNPSLEVLFHSLDTFVKMFRLGDRFWLIEVAGAIYALEEHVMPFLRFE